jgi:hypothetical protein
MKYSLMTFSIRDPFWFTVVVALAVGWWVERRARLAVQAVQAEERMKQELPYRQQQAALRHAKTRAARALPTTSASTPNPSKP